MAKKKKPTKAVEPPASNAPEVANRGANAASGFISRAGSEKAVKGSAPTYPQSSPANAKRASGDGQKRGNAHVAAAGGDGKVEPQAEEDAIPSEPEDDCDGNCLACEMSPCPDIVNDWGRLQEILDYTTDINEKVLFLQSVVSRNKFLCYNGNCPVFKDIIELRRQLADFDLPITDSKELLKAQLSGQQRKILVGKYKQAKYKCDQTLQEIMRVATVNRANEQKDETFHRRRLELIDKLNQSHFPVPVDVKADIEDQLNMKPDAWQQAQAQAQAKVTTPTPPKQKGA